MNETVQCITSDGRAGNDVVNGRVARVSEKGIVRDSCMRIRKIYGRP